MLTLALGGAVYAVGFSSAFGVREVQVQGVHRLTTQEVIATAKVPDGRPLARLDTTAIKRRVAELPQVAAVDVQRNWPHTVLIQVTERTAVAYAVDAKATVWLVDINGVAFASAASPPADLVKYVSATPSKPSAADKAALQVASGLPDWLVKITQSISASSPDGVKLTLSGSRTVVWGSAADSSAKATALKALLAQKSATAKHGVYDVSSPEFVTVR
jgi:cell division protein FtsQ